MGSVVCKQELEPELGHMAAPKNVSDLNLSRLVRQIALHCNLAAVIHVKSIYNKGDPYASNWLERLRAIKRLKTKVLKELKEEKDASGLVDDFCGNQELCCDIMNIFNLLFYLGKLLLSKSN